MNEKTTNFVSPFVFAACGAIVVYFIHLLIRGIGGVGIANPGALSHVMLLIIGAFIVSVWGTLAYVGYQLLMISRDR